MPKTAKTKKSGPDKYWWAVGRRKTATASVRLYPVKKKARVQTFTVNQKPLETYFSTSEQCLTARKALAVTQKESQVSVEARVTGGGITAQAGAVAHGLARAVLKWEPSLGPLLRAHRLLTRDPRMKERRKFGLKKARKAPQWSKR